MKPSNRKLIIFCVAVLSVALCVPAAQAQQKQKDPRLNPPVKPLPPIGVEESSSTAENPVPQEGASSKQNNLPLSGVQEWTPSGSGGGRNFFLANLSVYSGGDTNANGNGSTVSSTTTVGGTAALQRVWRHSQFALNYAGGTSFYTSVTGQNRTNHNLGISLQKTLRRWTLYFADNANYSPEGGYGGNLGLGSLGPNPNNSGGLVNLSPLFIPNQSVVATNSPRVSNTVVGQAQFSPNARSSITFAGSYGILRFIDPGFVNSDSIGVRAGYNRSLTAKDTLGLSFDSRVFRYEGTNQRNLGNVLYVSYGRAVSSRMTLQLSVGPQFTQAQNVTTSTGPGTTNRLSWSAQGSLQYLWAHSSVGVSYVHAVSGGSGYFLGANTDNVGASYAHQLSRMWGGSVQASYYRSQNLQDFLTGVTGQRYRGWNVGYNVSRPVGRYTSIYLNYSVQRQTSVGVNCAGPSCAFSGLRHMFGVGFNFHPSAIRLE